jgi:hypothetical protein
LADTLTAKSTTYCVAYGNGRFVSIAHPFAAIGGISLVSTDGVNWSAYNDENTTLDSVMSIAYGAGLFVLVKTADDGVNCATSPDGIVWTARATPITTNASWRSITYGNGLFVAVGANGNVMTSPDGITWTLRSAPAGAWISIAYGDGRYVAISNTTEQNGVITSSDGITWISGQSALPTGGVDVVYAHNLFLAIAADGKIQASASGISWVSNNVPVIANAVFRAVGYGNGIYVAVGDGGLIATSSDGLNWTKQISPTAQTLSTVVYGNCIFVAASSSQFFDSGAFTPSNVFITSP